MAERDVAQLDIIHGDAKGALQHLQTSLTLLSPQQDTGYIWSDWALGQIHFQRGAALTQLGSIQEAISAYAEAQRNAGSTGIQVGTDYAARAQAHMGELYYALGKPDDGDVHLTTALSQFNATAKSLPSEPDTHTALVVLLCMCPNLEMRDSERAVRLAERSIDYGRSSGSFWRYLALARYRAVDLEGAEEAVLESRKLRQGGDALDSLLLAAIKHGAGDEEAARAEYDKASNALTAGDPIYYDHIDPFRFAQFRAEVEKLLALRVDETSEDP